MTAKSLAFAFCLGTAAVLTSACATLAPAAADQNALRAATAAPTRTAANVARDAHRHPVETLSFFGVKPSDTVVEIWPGGGWYTEILAPYVAAGRGRYIAAAPERSLANVRKLIAA